ncbi:MAG TPA: hypothetical protein VF202_09010 [Trueperaceae bacterium]
MTEPRALQLVADGDVVHERLREMAREHVASGGRSPWGPEAP